MASHDVIEMALTQPMEWANFERLCYEILINDDLPRLRRLGNVGDDGIDAIQEAFYQNEQTPDVFVQITSERAELQKFKDTVKKLEKNGYNVKQLLMVYKHPVGSQTRLAIQREGAASSIAVDTRDFYYLIAQLGKTNSSLFSRFFGSTKEQLNFLLEEKDPLEGVNSKTRHAMLASIASFVLHPRAPMAKKTLFERTVVAAIASRGGSISTKQLKVALKEMLPGEHLDDARVVSTIGSLIKQGFCSKRGETITLKESEMATIGLALARVHNAYQSIISEVLRRTAKGIRIDDATKGYIERNIQRAFLSIAREATPYDSIDSGKLITCNDNVEVGRILSDSVPDYIARRTIASLSSYISEPENAKYIAIILRSYAGTFLRNLDPLGRRLQKLFLSRSAILLDTDLVLRLIVKELPEHKVVYDSLTALIGNGTKLQVTRNVMDESVNHVIRAPKTFKRFGDQLLRFSPEMVDGQVWHAVVRGFYFANRQGLFSSKLKYYHEYFDKKDSHGFLEYILKKRIKVDIIDSPTIAQFDLPDAEGIIQNCLERKERQRWKAKFRDPEQMRERLTSDLAMALEMAKGIDPINSEPKGYILSDDGVFRAFQINERWHPRKKVHFFSRAIACLAEYTAGLSLPDDQLVQLLFNPIHSAATELLASEIKTLSSAGVDLANTSLERLEWKMSGKMRDVIDKYSRTQDSQDTNPDEKISATVDLLEASKESGLTIDSTVENVVNSFRRLESQTSEERRLREIAEQNLNVAISVTDKLPKKSKRKVRRILQSLGVLPETEKDKVK